MNPRLIMDIDYHDLTIIDRGGPEHLRDLFDQMAQAGFDSAIFDCLWCGTATYHSSRIPRFKNSIGWAHTKKLVEQLNRFDPLALGMKLGKERGIQVMAYYRLQEEAYAPFDGDDFFKKNPEYWWQTRCGNYRLVGGPCFNYPEVREHMMQRVADLVEHGIEGILFGLSRSHIAYFNAQRLGRDFNAFGFNAPVVKEFYRRHKVNLSKFDYVEDVASADHGGVPFTYEHRWVGTEPYDTYAFRRLLGEGFDLFFRDVRRRYPKLHIAVEADRLTAGCRPEEAQEPIFRIDLEGLCSEGIIDEYVASMNYRQEKLPDVLLPRFQHVLDHGRQLTLWLNDIFSPTGGGGAHADDRALADYVDKVLASGLNSVLIHEAEFLCRRENPGQAWKQVGRFKGKR